MDNMDSPLFLGFVVVVGLIVLPLVALDSCQRERDYHPRTPEEWSSGATPDDTDETEW